MNLDGLTRVVADLYDALVHRRPRRAAIAFVEGLRKDVRRAFDLAVDPVTGVPWPPLRYRTGRPLVLTGTLRRSALHAVDSAVPSGAGVAVVLDSPGYARYHQDGTSRVPRRRFFGVSVETREAAAKAYSAEVVSLMVK